MLLIKGNAICFIRVHAGVCTRDECAADSDLGGETNDCARYVGGEEGGDGGVDIAGVGGEEGAEYEEDFAGAMGGGVTIVGIGQHRIRRGEGN